MRLPLSSSPASPSEQPSRPRTETLRELFRDSYLAFDRRTLGVTRLCLGFYLIMDLFRRTPDWEHMFGDDGVLPATLILWKPQAANFSLLHAFSTRFELWALWCVVLVTYTCLFVGHRTKLAQVLSVIFVTSLNGRVLLIENGGYVVENLLVLWTAFLPLGDRFGLDALRASLRRKGDWDVARLADRSDVGRLPNAYFSLAGLAITLQLSAIYYFNVVHKTGPAWHNGTAVHYVLYNDRMATPIVALVREHVPFWFIRIATPLVLTAEGSIPFCLLLPKLEVRGVEVKTWLRRVAIVLICSLHIVFGSSFVLGPFAWALCIFSTLLFSREDWAAAIRAARRPSRARTVVLSAESGAALVAGRLLATLDRFELLDFRAASTDEERAARIGVRWAGSEADGLVVGHRALHAIVTALPLGPIFAWMCLVPGLSHAIDAALHLARGRASHFWGWSPERAEPGDEMAPLIERENRPPIWRARFVALVREGLVVVMLAAAANQALVELWSTRKGWNALVTSLNQTGPFHEMGVSVSAQPEIMRDLSQKLRFLQGWFMFSPNPVMDDGTLVIDAVTADGRHLDPFWDTAPNFDLEHARSLRYNQIWSDYFNRMHLPGNQAYRDAMVDYMRRLPERTGRPTDRLVSGEVYWLSDMNPKWGTRVSYGEQKQLLFSFAEKGGAQSPTKPMVSAN